MRNLSLNGVILISLLLISASTFSQSYAPLGAEWIFAKTQGSSLLTGCTLDEYYSVTVDSSGSINGKEVTYFRKDDSLIAIYQDSNKVYCYENDSFHLMLDLGVTVGDTMIHLIPRLSNHFDVSCACWTTHSLTHSVLKGDTITIHGTDTFRMMVFEAYYTEADSDSISRTWSHRVGRDVIPFIIEACHLGWCCSDRLVCYEDSTRSFSLFDNCEYNVGIKEIKQTISISPNPAHDRLILNDNRSNQVDVFNLEGRKITLRVSDQAIDIGDLAPGMYFISSNGMMERFIKL